jgi:hypothetical protein
MTTDHISASIATSEQIAAAVRIFFNTPAVRDIFKSMVADAVLSTMSDTLERPSVSCSNEQARFREILSVHINALVDDGTRDFITEDSARDFIREEIESEPRYFIRAIERAVENTIDTDAIVEDAKTQVLDNLGADIKDHISEHFDDDDNFAPLAKRIIESICISIGDRNFTPEKID